MTTAPIVSEVAVAARKAALAERLAAVKDRIQVAGGDDVQLLAVSKGHPVEAALAACQLGLDSLGENYAQELLGKAVTLASRDEPMSWHFIGQLQTNKVRLVAEHVQVWQSVDRLKVGKEIAKRAPGAIVFAQANLSAEVQKAGCSFEELDALVDSLRELDLHVQGLMGVGAAANSMETGRGFERLRAACDRLGLAECSMGMTADLEQAIGAGSTMVRVGSDLFGPRS